jgi:hypothetical protein
VNANGPLEIFIYTLTRKGRVETASYRTVELRARRRPEINVWIESVFRGGSVEAALESTADRFPRARTQELLAQPPSTRDGVEHAIHHVESPLGGTGEGDITTSCLVGSPGFSRSALKSALST